MPINSINLSDSIVSAHDLFSSQVTYEIKPPQRRYKWGKREIHQLWQDIRKASALSQESYFLGSIILQSEGDRFYIIDGQQRIVSLSLLIAVLRDACLRFASEPAALDPEGLRYRADKLQELIVQLDNGGHPTGPLTLTLQDSDQLFYEQLVRQAGSTNHVNSGQSNLNRLSSAVNEFKMLLYKHIEEQDSVQESSLTQIYDYIKDSTLLLPITVNSEPQAYMVFDTTNTRGLPLSPSEALKARLFVAVRDNHLQAQNLSMKWDAASRALELAEQPDDAMDQYLVAVWSSKYGHTARKKLADAVIEKLMNEEETQESIADDIGKYVTAYLAVTDPRGADVVEENLRDLSRLRLTQATGFLTMAKEHAPTQFAKAVSLTLTLYVRNLLIGGRQPHDYQDKWPEWAKQARNGQIEIAFESIRDNMIDDDEFREGFAVRTVGKLEIARHLFRRLDPIHNEDSGVILSMVDREHIMPVSVVTALLEDKTMTVNIKQWIVDLGFEVPESKESKQTLGRILDAYLNRIGNQAFFESGWNRSLSNHTFHNKKPAYATQGLKLTESLLEYDCWNIESIESRQRNLAERAVRVWPKHTQ